jgi:Mn-dependent DtxR family transcriptional regulator
MHEEYMELQAMRYVKVAHDISVKLTKAGKELVAALRKRCFDSGLARSNRCD